jgi:hypothetical protein
MLTFPGLAGGHLRILCPPSPFYYSGSYDLIRRRHLGTAMKHLPFAASLILLAAMPAIARDDAGRWVTFRTGHNSYGPVQYQIDRTTIRRQGPYFTFQTRMWAERIKQPVAVSVNEALFYWSQTFVVDCAHRKFGARFIDSTIPSEARHKTSLEKMRWDDLAKTPAVGRTVCGDH